MDHQAQWQGEERRTLSHIESQLEQIKDCIREVKEGFPNGDMRGHREAHEAMIRAAKAQETFWVDLKEDIAKKGIWFLLITICGFIWIGLLAKFGIGIKP